MLEAWPDPPAMVIGRYLDVLAANQLAIALRDIVSVQIEARRARQERMAGAVWKPHWILT